MTYSIYFSQSALVAPSTDDLFGNENSKIRYTSTNDRQNKL